MHYGHAKAALTVALKKLIAAEPDVTNYDTIVGDGDCGIGLQRGAEGTCNGAFMKGSLMKGSDFGYA